MDIREDGSILLNMDYFSYATGLMVFEDKWEQLFGMLGRRAESEISQVYMDMALAIQQVTEEIVTAMELTKSKYLVLLRSVSVTYGDPPNGLPAMDSKASAQAAEK